MLTERVSRLTSIFSQANVAMASLATLAVPAIANPIQPVRHVPQPVPQPATGASKAKAKKKKVKRTQEKLQFPRKKPRVSAAGKKSSSKARSKPPQSALREVSNTLSTTRTSVNLLGRFHGAQSLHNNHGGANRATCSLSSLSPQARLLMTERVRELEEEENLVPAPATRAPTPTMRHRATPAAASTSHHAVPSASTTADASFTRGPRAMLPSASSVVPRHISTPTSGPASTASPGRRAAPTAAPSATGGHAIAPISCLGRCHESCCRYDRPWATPCPSAAVISMLRS